MKSKRAQSRLLEHDEALTLDKAIDIARTGEATAEQLQDIRREAIVNVVSCTNTKRPFVNNNNHNKQQRNSCGYCGLKDEKASCPAWGTKCRQCGKLNHWQKMCRYGSVKPKAQSQVQRKKIVNNIIIPSVLIAIYTRR